MADNVFYNPARPFINQAHLLMPYVVGTNDVWETTEGATLTEDANGYPIGFSSPVVCNTAVILYGGHPNGTWNLDWVGPNNAVTVSPGTNGATSCTFTKSTTIQQFNIKIHQPISDIRIWHSSENVNSGTFTAAFLQNRQIYSILRLMNWCNPNYLGWTPTWATRRTPNSMTQARRTVKVSGIDHQTREMAWDFIVQFANAMGKPIWINLHHLADSSYQTSVAQYLHANLNPGITVYVEWSNEVWNGGFPVNAYCIANGDPTDTDPYRRGYVYAMDRTAEMGGIFKANMPGRTVKTVFNVQSSGGVGFMDYCASKIKPASQAAIDVYSPAPYFGGNVGTSDANRDAIHAAWGVSQANAVNEVFAQIDAHLADLTNGPYAQMSQWKARCDAHGKQLIAYEGGQHLAMRGVDYNAYDTTVGQAMILANQDARMRTRYLAYLNEWWTRSGGAVLCHYTDVFTPQQRYGSWGAKEHEDEILNGKNLAILDFLGGG